MIIASWNVNSIKAHLEATLAWVKEAKPDVLCLQEIKCEDQGFPAAAFGEIGYNVTVNGQKTYNGIAILTKARPENIVRGLPGNDGDVQARYLEVMVADDLGPVTVASLYAPNGNPPDTDKYAYKLRWMDRLIARAEKLLQTEEAVVLAGDYNIIPAARDARFPDAWRSDALFLPPSREKYRRLLALGYSDAVRLALGDQPGPYTFWDYQAGAWQKDNGIRIDHHLLSPQAADRLQSARVDRHVRGWEKPSDHVPVIVTLK